MLSLPRSYYHRPEHQLCPWTGPAGLDLMDLVPSFDQMLTKPLVKNDKFLVDFDLRNFDPNGIKIKFENGAIEVNAKQEKKGDGHYEYREFVRKISVPKEVDESKLKCCLDKDGRLRIEAPVKKPEAQGPKEIPIQIVNQK